ncbi:N-acetylornithine carbamoyltransferase [Persicobacter psychrovividus]|uniref:N-succinylornithine carbamoyltransferase n=1 Tax=Persicobacter psychrovividus TaxID=387638 RepID=A0ABM7VKP0_9BACT|nr:N-acetylornithine carbamoyltransferase [Persicobacter psychrovividus]
MSSTAKFTNITDVNNLNAWIEEARYLKRNPHIFKKVGAGKCIGLVFFNPSLRTRMSSQRAAQLLGMDTIVLNVGSDGWNLEMSDGAVMDQGAQEHIKDAIQVMSQYCDLLAVRAFADLKNREEDYSERILNDFIKYSDVPVISLESATGHPLQAFADMITIEEQRAEGRRPKVVLTWAPHPRALPQAVANSFVEWVKASDADLVITNPEGYDLAKEVTEGVKVEYDQDKAFADADFIYAKNWSSYEEYGKILSTDSAWQVTSEKMALTNNAKFMHCLPIRRNVVASDEVIDNSIVIKQAENRLFAAAVAFKKVLEQIEK